MQLRITVKNTGNRTNDLHVATSVRRDLFAHGSVKVVPGSPLHGIHRDENRRAYFEFVAEKRDEVDQIFDEYRHAAHVELSETNGRWGEPCQNCGNIAGSVRPTVCPNCGFRDITPCPFCREEIPRESYFRQGNSLFQCPNCRNRVRLLYNEPMFLTDGNYNQPLVIVEEAEVHAT